jgi:hypothetical protein
MSTLSFTGDIARLQREHGFRHSVDHAQQGAGRTLGHELTLFPTAHRRDRDADPARELGLRQSGASTNAPHPSRGILSCFGIIEGGLAFDLRFGGRIDPCLGSRLYPLPLT